MANVSVRDAGRTFLVNLSIQAVNIFTGVICARLLQPEGRGALATVVLWPTILAGVGILGTNWALAREAAASPEREADLARTAVVLGIVQATFFGVLGYFLVPHLLPSDKQHLTALARLFLLFLPLNFISLNLIALEQGRLRWRRYNLARLPFFIIYAILLLCFWLARVNQVIWFLAALLLSNLTTTTICLWLQWSNIYQGRIRLSEYIRIIKQSFPFFLAAVGMMMAWQVDKALVVGLLSTEEVGWYMAALTFAMAHASLGETLGVTSFAAMANEPDWDKQRDYVARVFRQATLLYLSATVAIALMSLIFLVPLFGASFAPAKAPAAILALATGLSALGQILNESLRGRGIVFPGVTALLCQAGVMGLAAWFWAPRYGIVGMVWAVVFGSVVQFLVLIINVMIRLSLRPADLWGLRPVEAKCLYSHLISFWPFNGRSLKEGRS